jgi:hypothetical protein
MGLGFGVEGRSIGGIDFCVLESETYWEVKRLHFIWGFERVSEIDFCEVTTECVLESEEIGV